MSTKQMSETYLTQYYWQKNGDTMPWTGGTDTYNGIITSEYAGDNTAPTPTERTDAIVEALAAAKKVLIKPPNGVVSIELRFRSDGTEDDANIAELYLATGVDHYRHVDQLTVTQGQQIYSTGIYFADTIASAGEQWISATSEPSPTNSIASYVLNMHAYDRLWVVASDLVTTSLYVDWRRH